MSEHTPQKTRIKLLYAFLACVCFIGLLLVLINQRLIGVPPYDPKSFRADITALIRFGRYHAAVAYLKSADPKRQAGFDKTGYLAVGEDLIVLPGVYPRVDYDRSRDWYMPGTQDAIEDEAWQEAVTRFAEQYNRLRASE